MIDSLLSFQLSPFQWVLAILCAFIVGISKAGLNNISIITVSILAWIFGSKISTGVILPMLIAADILAVLYYKREVHWQSLKKLWFWVVIGILLGTWVGATLNDIVFKKLMAALVLIVVIGMFWLEKRPLKDTPHSLWFSGIMGISTGFASMVGNQAGGFATVYLLSRRLSKNHFIGTNAWLFLFVNLFKLPFHIFIWKTIHIHSLSINIALLPFLLIGFYMGVYIVKKINEQRYRQVILWITALATLFVIL